jgi:hypothetical protein
MCDSMVNWVLRHKALVITGPPESKECESCDFSRTVSIPVSSVSHSELVILVNNSKLDQCEGPELNSQMNIREPYHSSYGALTRPREGIPSAASLHRYSESAAHDSHIAADADSPGNAATSARTDPAPTPFLPADTAATDPDSDTEELRPTCLEAFARGSVARRFSLRSAEQLIASLESVDLLCTPAAPASLRRCSFSAVPPPLPAPSFHNAFINVAVANSFAAHHRPPCLCSDSLLSRSDSACAGGGASSRLPEPLAPPSTAGPKSQDLIDEAQPEMREQLGWTLLQPLLAVCCVFGTAVCISLMVNYIR